VVATVVLVVELVVVVVATVVLVVELVVVVVATVVLVVELVVVVVVGVHIGSPGWSVQVQSPVLHWSIIDFLQVLRSLPEKAPHAELISSAHAFEPQIGGAAFAPETKTPAQSATAINVTTAFLVIVEPPMAVRRSHLEIGFGVMYRVPRLRHACQDQKELRSDAGDAAATMPRRAKPPGPAGPGGIGYAPESGSSRLVAGQEGA
jgi:hypothetical protein